MPAPRAGAAASMRLPTKPWQTPTSAPILPMCLAIFIAVAIDRLRGLVAAHDFEQPHHVGGREEMHADAPSPGRLVDGGDLVDVEIGGVGGEDRAGLGDRVELGEHVLLDRHVLEHRLDDEVAVGERGEIERPASAAPMRFSTSAGAHAALLGGVLVVLADDAEAAVERGLLRSRRW